METKFIPDGQPCEHPGCLSHLTHPCEGCGRIGGYYQLPHLTKEGEKIVSKVMYTNEKLNYLTTLAKAVEEKDNNITDVAIFVHADSEGAHEKLFKVDYLFDGEPAEPFTTQGAENVEKFLTEDIEKRIP